MELSAALVLGLIGSFHCIGMCGPIALAVPLRTRSTWLRALGALIYNFGRIITYAVFGAFFGALGWSLSLAGFQQSLSIGLGVALIGFVLYGLFSGKGVDFLHLKLPWLASVQRALGRLLKRNNSTGLLLIGLLNGLLPCGLVYMAVAGAIASGSAQSGSAFMAVFGLGTLPVMLLLPLAGGFIKPQIRKWMRKAVPAVLIVMGALFILRGLNLGIPYLSPRISYEVQGGVECH